MLMSLEAPRGGHRRKKVMNRNICHFESTNFVQIQFFLSEYILKTQPKTEVP